MNNQNYKPSMAKDKDYLESIANKISVKDEFEEIKFEYLTKALKSFGIVENPYDFVKIDGNDAVSIRLVADKSFQTINSTPLTSEQKQKLDTLWDYLAESDDLEKADLIYVFGGQGLERVTEGVKLLQERFADKLLFTGQRAAYMEETDISEAEYYAQVAKKMGVEDDQLILETKAINTVENVVNSSKIFHDMNWTPNKIILLTLPYHMRRAYLTFKAVAEWKPKLIRHSVVSENYSRDDYFKDKEGWSYVFYEYLKIYGARLMKHF